MGIMPGSQKEQGNIQQFNGVKSKPQLSDLQVSEDTLNLM